MLFSRRSATSACAIVLIVMAVTPYHRFSSSIGLASGAMTWLVILGACLAAFGHGVALRKGGEIRRPGRLGVFGVFLAAIAVVPEWVDLAFYARGDSIPIAFAPIWLLRGVSCASCFAGSLLLSYVIWDTAGSPLIRGGGAGRRKGDLPIAERAFCRNNSCPVLPAVLLSSFMESRSRAMGGTLCFGRVNWSCAFNSVGLSRIGCGPAVSLFPRLWSGTERRVCPFCARGSSYRSYSGCRCGILRKRCRGHCIAGDGVRYRCCLRMHVAKGETGQQFGYRLRVRPIRCGGVFPCPVA